MNYPLVNVGTVNSPNAHLTLILRLGEREQHYARDYLNLCLVYPLSCELTLGRKVGLTGAIAVLEGRTLRG